MDEVFGRYRLIELIGEGGMGRVYKAHDPKMRRDVAIKMLKPEFAAKHGYEERFRREAYTAARLAEPHVIPIYEADDIDGQLYLVMPWIKGTDVGSLLARDGPMTPSRAVCVIEQLAAALDAAHEAGLVHRDVKPSNALIDAKEHVYLIDFGIVHDAEATNLTKTGASLGTYAYMAPEGFSGRIDTRGDVYALACTLYECLTAEQPYPADSVIVGHLSADPPKPCATNAEIPAGFDEVIARGMAKGPGQRYQTPHEFATAARRALTETGPAPRPSDTAPVRVSDLAMRAAPPPTLTDGPSDPSLAANLPSDVSQQTDVGKLPIWRVSARPTPPTSAEWRRAPPASRRLSRRTTIAVLAGAVAVVAMYATIKLFSLPAAPQPAYQPNRVLDVARVAAPIVAAVAAVFVLILLLRNRVQQWRIRFTHGHVVICGLGYVGFEFVRQLRNAGYNTVAVEADATSPHIKPCRGWGVPVIVGDARQQPTLRATRVTRAARLLAVTPENAVNAEILTRTQELVTSQAGDTDTGERGRNRRRLRCLAQIDDPDLCVLLRLQESNRGDAASALDFFNTEQIGARILLEENPIDTGHQPHILVAHLDALAVAVVFDAARRWHHDRNDNLAPLLVTVVDDHAEQRVDALLGQYPSLGEVCKFSCYSADVRDIRRLAAHHRAGSAPPISRAYVTAYHDELTVETALTLRHELDATVPVVAAVSGASGVAGLLHETSSGPQLTVFKTLEKTCTIELVEGGSFEAIAQAVHDRYREMERMAGRSTRPWSELDASFKDASRAHAREIAAKLLSIGCQITPLRDWRAAEFAFAHDELEKLAMMEHDRWWKEKIADGWSLGEKDPQQPEVKSNPYMVPFEDLPSDIAEYDRAFVGAIPEMLASVGLQVIRVSSAPAGGVEGLDVQNLRKSS
ncbi:MAG: hypothetical protein QOH91_3312 [Mycobacterium sp.]|nr:hypothetical protein [Mycobacterium sp.]